MDNGINNLQNENETVNRPSKSVVAGSSPAGPTTFIGESAKADSPPLPENDGRGCLNAGRTLAGFPGAESIERERWCEQMHATVTWFPDRQEWQVAWYPRADFLRSRVADTRAAAIDAARGAR